MARLELVVDANPLISALLGGGGLRVLFDERLHVVTTEHTTWEVKRYIPMISSRSGVPEEIVLELFETFPLIAYQSSAYETSLSKATNQIGLRDPKDVDIFALTYHLGAPLWTEDPDLISVSDIQTVTTQELFAIIQSDNSQ